MAAKADENGNPAKPDNHENPTKAENNEDPLQFSLNDPEDPRNWPFQQRLYSSLMPVLFGFLAGFLSTVYVGALLDIQAYFSISTELAISGFTFYALGVAFGPLVAAPISELYGQRIIYHCGLPLAIIFMVAGGVAQNFQTIAVSRFFTGVAIGPATAVGAGTISDVWDVKTEVQGALIAVLFAAIIFIGAELGPVAGALLTQDRGWRWSFWVSMIVAGGCFLLSLPMKETKKSQILRWRAKRLKLPLPQGDDGSARNFAGILVIILSRSLDMLFREPMVFFTALHGAYALALFYFYYIAIPYVTANVYGFTLNQIGLSFLPMIAGSFLAIPIFIAVEKTLYQKAKMRSPDKRAPPEARLYGAMIASVMIPTSLFWFAWTARSEVHWAAPLLSGVFFGMAQVLLNLSLNIYMFDVYEEKTGASAVAGSSMLRYLLAAVFPLFTLQLLENLGIGWGMSLFGFISVLLFPIPWLLSRWGPWLRSKSKYMPV